MGTSGAMMVPCAGEWGEAYPPGLSASFSERELAWAQPPAKVQF